MCETVQYQSPKIYLCVSQQHHAVAHPYTLSPMCMSTHAPPPPTHTHTRTHARTHVFSKIGSRESHVNVSFTVEEQSHS